MATARAIPFDTPTPASISPASRACPRVIPALQPALQIVHKRADGLGEPFYVLRNLALLRCYSGLTQQQVAMCAWSARGGGDGQAVWPKTIGVLERRRRGARLRTLRAIADGLGVSLDELCRPLSADERHEIHARLAALRDRRVVHFTFRDGRAASIKL